MIEALRVLKAVRKTAVQARWIALQMIGNTIVSAPEALRDDEKTKVYAARRTAEGKTRREIVRCIKRYIIREIYRHLCAPPDLLRAD